MKLAIILKQNFFRAKHHYVDLDFGDRKSCVKCEGARTEQGLLLRQGD